MTGNQSKHQITVAAGVLTVTALLACSSGVAAADLQPRTVKISSTESEFAGVKETVKHADVVAVAHFTGVSDRKYTEYTQPGGEGYYLGDPGDVYSLLNFQVVKSLKGGVPAGETVRVAVRTGLLNERTFLPGKRLDRISQDGFDHFFDGTVRKEAASPTKYTRLISLNARDNGTFSAASWALAPIVDDTARIGARVHGEAAETSTTEITAIPVGAFAAAIDAQQ